MLALVLVVSGCVEWNPISLQHHQRHGAPESRAIARGSTSDSADTASSATVSPPATRVLTEFEFVQEALANHGRQKIAAAQLEMALGQLVQAESSFWPQVSATVSNTHLGDDTEFVVERVSGLHVPKDFFKIKTSGRNIFNASLDVMLPLYTGGRRSAYVEMAQSGVRIAEEGKRLTEHDLIRLARRAYYTVVLTRELLQLAQATKERFDFTLELTERLYTAGSETVDKTDFLRTQVIVSNIASFVAEMESNNEMAKAGAGNAIGEPWNVEVDAADRELRFHGHEVGDLSSLVGEAYALRPDWKQMKEAIRVAESQVKLARSGHYPQVAFMGTLHRIRDEYDAGAITPNGDTWTVGIYAHIPLFEGFRTTGAIRTARAGLEMREAQRLLLKDGIGLQIKDAFLRLERARKQVDHAIKASEVARENRELNARAYQNELVETKDVIEAQLLELFTDAQRLRALYDWNVALVELDYFIGKATQELLDASAARSLSMGKR